MSSKKYEEKENMSSTQDLSIDKKSEVIKKIQESLNRKEPMRIVSGAYGDMSNCNAIVEKVIKPPTGGTFTKFYGCSYLFKGYPLRSIVEGLSMGKTFISMIPREIVMPSIIFKLAIAFLYLFAKGRLIHYCRVYIYILYRNLVHFKMPLERYNKPTLEIRKAVDIVLSREFNDKTLTSFEFITTYMSLDDIWGTKKEIRRKELYWIVATLAEFVYLFLEMDNAYRLRVQDITKELNKENVKKSVVKEVGRLFDILIEREQEPYGIKSKWRQMKKVVIPILRFNKHIRRLTKEFLLHLDIQYIMPDDADWYFSLRRRGYNFGGLPVKERLKEKEEIDKKRGHLFIQFAQKQKGTATTIIDKIN